LGVHGADPGKGPRYGLLVITVAVISVIVPVTLFFVLQRAPETAERGDIAAPAAPASELETHDQLRLIKGTRGKNGVMVAASAAPSASASAAASASASAAPSGKGAPGPRSSSPSRR
jgi:hypothetical protein